jgi:uncharacterized repeat protein (TIGR01451 family)
VRLAAAIPRWTRLQAAAALGLCCFALVGWQGVSTVGRSGGNDAGEHLAFAQYLYDHGHLPGRGINYEYPTPPLFHGLAVAAEIVVRHVPAHAVETPWNPLTRLLWLALAAGGIAALTAARPRLRLAGAAALGLAALWGIDEALTLAKTEAWSVGQLLALAAGTGLLVVTGLIARELWPEHPRRALAAGAMAAAYPVVYRLSILFHPEMQNAFLCGLAILLFLRAARRGWPTRLGAAVGATLGAEALTRQTAVVVIGCLAVASVVLGRREAARFIACAGVVVLLVAGPWWGYAIRTWHNPLQSDLDRPSLMLGRQPFSFYVSAPIGALVLHPYRPDFSNELLPKLHAELWSDWFGVIHPFGSSPSTADRVTASTQSVLGFVGDALGIGGLVLLALPAARRALRRSRDPAEAGLGVLALLTVTALVAFAVMLVRFPQQYGDPIKSSYLLFTAPAWAVFAIAAWVELRRRPRASLALAVVAVLYVASYGADLAAAFSHRTVAYRETKSGVIDLSSSIQVTTPLPDVGGPIGFAVTVDNLGNQTADDVVLTVKLPPGMQLLAPPFYERGSGCTGTSTISCNLDFLAGNATTLIRFQVTDTATDAETMVTSVTSAELDVNPHNNAAALTVDLLPPAYARSTTPPG